MKSFPRPACLLAAILPTFLSLLPGLARSDDPLVVQAPNYPLYYFADRIATDGFDVRYRVPEDIDPAFWEPAEADVVAFQKADIILRNGATYSKWMHKVSLPSSRIVDTSREFRDRFIETEGEEHSHGDGHVHTHGGVAFVTWLDFEQAKVQANSIARRFRAMRPAEADAIDANLEALEADLAKLHEEAKGIGGKLGEVHLAASHPVYQYLARAYGLKVESLEWEPEMTIDEKASADLAKLLEKHPAKWMIWEGEATSENVAKVAESGLKSIVISPGANRPSEGDWLHVMRENLKALASIEGAK